MPLLVLIVVLTAAASFFIMLPDHFEKVVSSASASLLFVSNVFFWRNTGYFDLDADLQPLLHTWSLSVEEQFYIIYPFVLLLFIRMTRGNLGAVGLALWLLVLASFGIAEWASEYAPTANFYLIMSRGWELGVGAIVAITLMRARLPMRLHPGRFTACLADGALFVLFACYVLFDRYVSYHPGHWTLIPVAATAVFILFFCEGSFFFRILCNRPVIYIGKVSYGFYLWHFPVFALVHYTISAPTALQTFGMILAAFVLSCASYHWFETPLRFSNVSRRLYLWACVAAIATALFFVNVLGSVQNKLLTENQMYTASIAKQVFADSERCMLDATVDTGLQLPPDCIDEGREIFVWDDSHANALANGFRFGGIMLNEVSASSCPPVLDQAFFNVRTCEEINNFAFRKIIEVQPKILILHGYWHAYNQQKLTMFDATLTSLRQDLPNTKLVVIGTVPLWHPSLNHVVQQRDIRPFAEMTAIPPFFDKQLLDEQRIAGRVLDAGLQYLSALSVFCSDGGCRVAALDPEGDLYLTTYDYGHLNPVGALLLGQRALQDLGAKPRTATAP